MNTRNTLKINSLGHIEIGGVDVLELKRKYGTPLYVLDIDYILDIISVFSKTIRDEYGCGRVSYASKALSTKAIYELLKNTDAGCDVVSGGELYTALSVGFPCDRLELHGNNKLPNEVQMAIENNVNTIVLDGFDDIKLVAEIAEENNKVVNVLLRLNPGISAHTHEFVQTAQEDSKFGLSISNGSAIRGIGEILQNKWLHLNGIHTHIGSQIFEYEAFVSAAKIMTDFILTIKNTFGFEIDELNMGGGFGIYYEGDDKVFTLETYANHLKALITAVKSELIGKGLKKPFLTVEPGRAIVGEAGITLYTVGGIKDIPNIRKYVAVDGGLFDNPRYALYGSRYSAVIADRANEIQDDFVTVCGKCCESGDLIAKDINLQKAKVGDTLCVFSTGAYNYSMASNYNRNLVPPMVAVRKGQSAYIVKPQTYEDIVRNDVVPDIVKSSDQT
ncbi:MAG: diaminopimelate decarboxylase [Clostridia bacterium]